MKAAAAAGVFLILIGDIQLFHFLMKGIPVNPQKGRSRRLDVIGAFQGDFYQASFHHGQNLIMKLALRAFRRMKKIHHIFELLFQNPFDS